MKNQHDNSEPSRPTQAQIAAAIDLLGDDRGPIQAAARERLLKWGELAVAMLREGAEADHVRTRARCRAVLRTLEIRDCLRRFSKLRLGRLGRGSAPALLEGAVLLSKMVRTFVPEAAELAARLRRHATELRAELVGRSLPTCARLLAERLHDTLGLQGGRASVLELDCGDGGNLIPLAERYPLARFLGIDPSPRQVAAAQEEAAAVGLLNIEFRAGRAADLGAELGLYDYIIADGVYTLCDAAGRDRLLAVCSDHLAPRGIAFLGLRVYPGWHPDETLAKLMRFQARASASAASREKSSNECVACLCVQAPLARSNS